VARASLVAIGAVLLVGGGALAGYGLTRTPAGVAPQVDGEMGSAVAQLDADVKASSASVKERAATFASLQQVIAAIETDEETTKDMFRSGELKFVPRPGEVIELGQVPAGEDPAPLLVQPEGGMRTPRAGETGSFADLMDDKLVITEVVSVPAKKRTDLRGYVAVSRPLDLGPALDRLAAAGVVGTFQVGNGVRSIGAPAAGAPLQEVPLPSLPSGTLRVSAPATAQAPSAGRPVGLIAGGGGVAALGLFLLVLGLVSGGAGASMIATSPPPTGFGNAKTQRSSAALAAGTPAPYESSAALASPHGLGPGATVGRWEIIKRLGSGGMADVYLARSKGEAGFEKTVAVKVMHPHLARNQPAVEHFLDEARLAAQISHPNVVAIQDLGKIGNDYVIVMDYVDGVDLERLLSAARAGPRPVPINVGLGILCRICDGLDAAHKAIAKDGTPLHVIHRDVKSANVLVSRQGGVKVVDFGIAKAAQQGHQTVAGETKGTPSMMAPEQRIGEQVDVRADVYSTAAVAYEVLTGHGVNLDLAALAHLGVENWPHLPAPSSLRAELPPELDAILLGAMSYDRENRPADCAALEVKLEAVMKTHGLIASDKDIARWVTSELAHQTPLAHDSTSLPA
jgi:hypothetical protein